MANWKPLSTTKLWQYEKWYSRPFNVTVGKLLHIQQWTCSDLTHAISRLELFLKAHLRHRITLWNIYIIMYIGQFFSPYRPNINEEIITYDWSPKQQTIYSTFFGSLVLYSNSVFTSILWYRCTIQSNVTTLNGVTIDWTCNIHSKVIADLTNNIE